ncbi:MAG: hypothetical protein O3C27_07340 [Actinomycetota bacterium]|nr:hypothetical protein [Actinomycetota bacterium]
MVIDAQTRKVIDEKEPDEDVWGHYDDGLLGRRSAAGDEGRRWKHRFWDIEARLPIVTLPSDEAVPPHANAGEDHLKGEPHRATCPQWPSLG